MRQIVQQGQSILQAKKAEILRALNGQAASMDYRKEVVVHLLSGDYEIDDDGWKAFARLRTKHPCGEVYKQRVVRLFFENAP